MTSLASMEALNKIKSILEKHPGNVQVFLSVGSGRAAKKIKTQTQVGMSNELMTELRELPEVVMIDVA